MARHEQSLYIASTRRWPTNSIPVCWEKTVFASDETARAWVRGAVESTWGAVSRVDFTGWGTCGWSSPGIRIRVSDEGPHVKQLGNMLNGLKDGMVLNFTFYNWGNVCNFTRQDCIEDIAVHEFGHALGFAHEQNRPDTPSSCVEEEQGENGDTLYGDWDLDSVMNYCNPKWSGDGHLSAYDTWGVQWAYRQNGNPVALRSHGGHYVMADGSVSATSATVNHMENLNLIDLGGGQVVLQAMNGHYLSAENGGGGFISANRPAVGTWETFTLVDL